MRNIRHRDTTAHCTRIEGSRNDEWNQEIGCPTERQAINKQQRNIKNDRRTIDARAGQHASTEMCMKIHVCDCLHVSE